MGDEVKTKKAFVTKDFNDSGTGRSFTASTAGDPDTMPDIEEGSFLNYEHAGLIRAATEDDTRASKASVTRNLPTAPVV